MTKNGSERILVSRRGLLKAGGGILIASALPAACGPGQAEEAAQVIFALVQAALLINEILKGSVKIDDPNTECRFYEILIKLTHLGTSEVVSANNNTIQICNGSQSHDLEKWNLQSSKEGDHQLSTVLDGRTFKSQAFRIGS